MLRKIGFLVCALALAATACTDDPGGGEAETAGEAFEEPRLVDMVNESNRLLYELESAENRIIQACLLEDGFTVHDQLWFSTPEPVEQEALFREDDWGNWLPPLEEAEKYGLGAWRYTDEGADSALAEEYAAYKGYELDAFGPEAGGGGVDRLDNAEFEALSPAEQYGWYAAYFGEEAAAQEWGYLIGEEAADSGGSADGSIDLGDDFDYVEPEPGGCRREMIDALYGDALQRTESPEGEEYREATWSWRPLNPVDDFAAYEEFDLLYAQRIAGVQGELVACLADHGHPGWEFDAEGTLPTFEYLTELYEGEADVHDHPDLPDDAPDDFEGQMAFEIAFAVALAECGDETGYRETAAKAWGDTREEYYVSIETEVYAWQEEVRGILTKAQEVLEG